MTGLSRAARVLSVALIASSAIFAIGLLLTSVTEGTGSLFLPFAGGFAAIAVLLTLAQPEVHRFLLRRLIRHREALYIGSMLVGTSVALAHYGLAAVALQYGPNPHGSDFLLTANAVAPLTALIAVLGQVVLVARGAPRLPQRVIALALLAIGTAVPVAALWLLGTGSSPAQPLDQQAAVDVMRGVGERLVVVPVAFAAGAALVPLAAWTRRRVRALRPPTRSASRRVGVGPIPAR